MFQVTQIAPQAYELMDEREDSFYLVVGSQMAAVIDTGITVGAHILPEIRKITKLPTVLVLTHAHIDHFHHMDEFNTVYMSHREMEMPEAFLKEMMVGKELQLERTLDIRTGSRIELGGQTLEICEVPGHTPGSVAVWNEQQNLLFTGDAIGSGCGVWMQLIGCLPLSEYQKSLENFLKWLVERGGRMQFFGGHNHQWKQSKRMADNPLSLGLLADLIDLVEKVRKGEIIGEPCKAMVLLEEPSLYAAYGRAEMVYRDGVVC